jgi:hypothetical protein
MRGDGRRLRPVVVWVGEEARGSWGWGSGRRRDEWEDAGGEENSSKGAMVNCSSMDFGGRVYWSFVAR